MRSWLGAVLVLWVVGCGPSYSDCEGCCDGCFEDDLPETTSTCVDAANPDQEVVIGSVESGPFSLLEPESTLVLDYGPQGGQHFYLALQLQGSVDGDMVRMSFTPESGLPAESTEFLSEGCPAPDALEIGNLRLEVPFQEETTGLLRVSLGRCANDLCEYNDMDGLANFVEKATAEVHVSVVPPT